MTASAELIARLRGFSDPRYDIQPSVRAALAEAADSLETRSTPTGEAGMREQVLTKAQSALGTAPAVGTMSDLAELLKRVEAATGPDRELEWDIDEAITGEVPDFHGCPHYTASIDDALALVERKLPDHKWGIHQPKDGTYRAHVTKRSPLRPMPNTADAPTAPLAILAALLAALLHEGQG
jgi:hypothetical protein